MSVTEIRSWVKRRQAAEVTATARSAYQRNKKLLDEVAWLTAEQHHTLLGVVRRWDALWAGRWSAIERHLMRLVPAAVYTGAVCVGLLCLFGPVLILNSTRPTGATDTDLALAAAAYAVGFCLVLCAYCLWMNVRPALGWASFAVGVTTVVLLAVASYAGFTAPHLPPWPVVVRAAECEALAVLLVVLAHAVLATAITVSGPVWAARFGAIPASLHVAAWLTFLLMYAYPARKHWRQPNVRRQLVRQMQAASATSSATSRGGSGWR